MDGETIVGSNMKDLVHDVTMPGQMPKTPAHMKFLEGLSKGGTTPERIKNRAHRQRMKNISSIMMPVKRSTRRKARKVQLKPYDAK